MLQSLKDFGVLSQEVPTISVRGFPSPLSDVHLLQIRLHILLPMKTWPTSRSSTSWVSFIDITRYSFHTHSVEVTQSAQPSHFYGSDKSHFSYRADTIRHFYENGTRRSELLGHKYSSKPSSLTVKSPLICCSPTSTPPSHITIPSGNCHVW